MGLHGAKTMLFCVRLLCCAGLMVALASQARPEFLSADVGFVFYDAGETLGLRPVVEQLASNGTRCNVLCCTDNAAQLMSSIRRHPRINVLPLQQVLNRSVPLKRNDTLPARQLQVLLHGRGVQLDRARVVVTGGVSAVQQQLAMVLHRENHSHVVAFDDGFGSWDTSSRIALMVRSGSAHELIVTADGIAKAVRAAAPLPLLPYGVRALGSPSLETWRQESTYLNTTAASSLRAAVMRQFESRVRNAVISHNSSVDSSQGHVDQQASSDNGSDVLLLFFGGYGGADYNTTIEELGKFALQAAARSPRVRVALTQHPGQGVERDVERAVLARVHADGVVAILPNTEQFTSSAVAAVANVTASEDSTCGVQSLFIGVPSMYIQPACCPGAPHTYGGNVAVDAGLLPVAENVSLALDVLSSFCALGYHFDAAQLTRAGVPLHATANVVARLTSILHAPVTQHIQ